MVVADAYLDISEYCSDVDGHFLESGGVEAVRAALAAGELKPLEFDGTERIGPPIARPSARSAFTSVVRSTTACAARKRTASEGSLSNASSNN